MAHGKDPAFPLYASDFLTDSRMWTIDQAEGFSLVRLWSFLWMEGPQTMDAIRSAAPMLRCDPDTAQRLAEEFTDEDDDGNRYSKRMEAERAERIELRERRKEAGRRGAKKRWRKDEDGKANGSAMAKPLADECPPSPSPSPSTPLPPKGGGDCCAEEEDPPADHVPPDMMDEMRAICARAGVLIKGLPLTKRLRAFHCDEGTIQDLRDLSAFASTGGDPGGLLVKLLEDPYRWKSALAEIADKAKHAAAQKRSRKDAADQDFRAQNGLPEKPGEESPRLKALKGGAA
jgi:hypothetical protein